MGTAILSAGLACAIAAVVGGGLKAFGIEIPALGSRVRQVILFILGAILIVVSMNLDSGSDAGTQTKPNAQPAQQAAAQPNGSADATAKKEHSSTLQWTYDGAANQCGQGETQRVKLNETASFTVLKGCLSVATLHLIRHDRSEQTFPLGAKSSPGGEVVLEGLPLDRGADVLYNYKLIQ